MLLALAARLPAGEAARDPATWRVWLEPRYMHSPLGAELPGAKKTELAGGFLTDLGLENARTSNLADAGLEWSGFRERALQNAAADLKGCTRRFERDRKRVIEYAILRSEQGLVASAVLSPALVKEFEETLGPDFLVVVPTRTCAYLFPKLASRYQEHAPEVLAEYRSGAIRVSLEVFEAGPAGLKAVGAFTDPAQD